MQHTGDQAQIRRRTNRQIATPGTLLLSYTMRIHPGLSTLAIFALLTTPIWSLKVRVLDTKNVMTYASSVAHGSSSDFATDVEVGVENPTCFQSLDGHYDASGFTWLVVDLGVVVENITEVYMAFGENDPTGLEVYVTKYMRSVVHYGGSPDTLAWTAYNLCGRVSDENRSGRTAAVVCDSPISGRWVILRHERPQQLQVCLIAVYVTKDDDVCFTPVHASMSPHVKGSEFRLERSISLYQCRSSCVESPTCNGLAYVSKDRRRRSGSCRLFSVPFDDSDSLDQPISCDPEDCQLELNDCNRGNVYPLIQDEGTSTVWKIGDPNPQKPKALFSLQFNGRIACEAESCGIIYVILITREGREVVCTTIDTDLVSVLDQHSVKCNSNEGDHSMITNVAAVKLSPLYTDTSVPQMKVTGGYARFVSPTSASNYKSSGEDSFPSAEVSPFPSINPKATPLSSAPDSYEKSDDNRLNEASLAPQLTASISEVPLSSIVPIESKQDENEQEKQNQDNWTSDETQALRTVGLSSEPVNPIQYDEEALPPSDEDKADSMNKQDIEKIGQASLESPSASVVSAEEGSTTLSMANMAAIIVLVSVVILVAIALAVWCVCVRRN